MFCKDICSELVFGFLEEGDEMDEALFESKLNELVNEIGALPPGERKKIITLSKNPPSCTKNMYFESRLEDSLEYLRVCVKYLLFDLEATRRENDYLKKIIEDKCN